MADVTAEQYGPSERIVRTCSACKACVSESYRCQSDNGHDVYCAHPTLPERKRIGDTTWSTPDWCPVLAARLSGMAADTWQPIETAPKDGRSILIGVGGWGKRVAQAEWDQWGDAADEGGWRCGRPGAKGYDDAGFDPTHWRELPAAPEPPHV